MIEVTNMLAEVKSALHITSTAYDSELQMLIGAALIDLGIAGVTEGTEIGIDAETITNKAIIRAVALYCGFNNVDMDVSNRDSLKKIYDETKAQLATATGYTDWLV